MLSVSIKSFINILFRFNPKDIVIEYVGEKIRNALADKREMYYD